MIDTVVREGVDVRLARDRKTGARLHTVGNVYSEMLLQIARDYPGLPDLRTLAMEEILYFYNGLRAELRRHTKPRPPR